MSKNIIVYVILKNYEIDILDTLIGVMYSVNTTVSTVTGLAAHDAFYDVETVVHTDCSVHLGNILVSNPMRFAETYHMKRRNELIKQCRELAAREMK